MNLNAQEGIMLLADATLKSAMVLIVAWCAAKLLRRSSAAMRHLLWTAALLALPVILVVSAIPGAGVEVLPPWWNLQPDTAVVHAQAMTAGMQPIPMTPRTESQTNVKMGSDPILTRDRLAGGLSGWTWLWIIYSVGVAAALLPVALGWLSVAWLTRRAYRVCSQTMTSQLQQARSMLGVQRHVTLLHSERRPVPMTWGIISPKVLLPSDAWQWSADRRLAVLLHELAHVKRYDCLTRTLAHIVCAMFWFNPLAWVAARRMNLECEQACDDMVLAAGQSGRSYAEHLLDIASNLQSNLLVAHHAIAMARPSTLERRLLGVLDPRRNRAAVSSALTAMVVLMAVVIAVPVAMLRAASPESSAPLPTVTPEVAKTVEQAVDVISQSTEGDPRVKTALDTLKGLDPQQVVGALVKYLDDPEPTRRRAAIFIFWQSDIDSFEPVVPRLMELTHHSEPYTAGMAALALGAKKVDSSYDRLADMTLHADDGYTRRCAAIALGWLGDPRAAEVLKQAVNDKDPLVVANAQAALKLLQAEAHVAEQAWLVEPLDHMIQEMHYDLRPGGMISFTQRVQMPNSTSTPMDSWGFRNSDMVEVTSMNDGRGQPLKFDVNHSGNTYRYHVALNEPVQPGGTLAVASEGMLHQLVAQVEPGLYRYHMNHSPGGAGRTRRIETHLLPAGATLVDQSDNLTQTTQDGRILLSLDTMIPEGGNVEVTYTYRLSD